uniref:G_PROTEIN_RECEP_F1_2 domain-containing protein n=1 Tax=Syphacia muris TaxID=451379 RepID=A0A0N5AJ37_9BILA
MFLGEIDGKGDLRIHNISILPSDQCATEDQRAAKCCCGDGYFFDFPTKSCKVSANVGFMFGRLNDDWSHMFVYGFAYPMIVIILTAPLCTVLIGMGKREKREADRRFPNPLYQMIWLLSFCGWISLLSPLPFSIWYYIVGNGTRSFNQSIIMCHIFRPTMEVIPNTVDMLMTLYTVVLAGGRFLTQYHKDTLKLRTIQRFSRAIWTIMIVCLLIGCLRFFEHSADVYQFCMDTEPGPFWASRCMVTDGVLLSFLSRNFWKVILPIIELFLQFLIPGLLLTALHIGFSREPIIDDGDNKLTSTALNKTIKCQQFSRGFRRSPRSQSQLLITAVTATFMVVQIPTAIYTALSMLINNFQNSRILSRVAIVLAHTQPMLSLTAIIANNSALLCAYYVVVKDDDTELTGSEGSFGSTETFAEQSHRTEEYGGTSNSK